MTWPRRAALWPAGALDWVRISRPLANMADHIRYDLLTQQALRGVVRDVLTETAKKGLVGDHHFYISFDTQAEGVKLSQRLRSQYPEEMTVILQHQFWDLTVNESEFRSRPLFRRHPGAADRPVRRDQRLLRSFGAVRSSVRADGGRPGQRLASEHRGSTQAGHRAEEACAGDATSGIGARSPHAPANPEPKQPPKAAGGAEVVRLDRFRKK